MSFRLEVEKAFGELQLHICKELEKIDGNITFESDIWKREEGGGGRTNTAINGNIIEKGGVAFSAVHGEVTTEMQQQLKMQAGTFFASGVSIVLHPHNVHIPIIHMNVRYFELDNGTYWFGGGIDLTPHIIVPENAKAFHTQIKNTLDKFDVDFYPKFKNWADDYFFIPHRNETRGIGGFFFDNLKETSLFSKDKIFEMTLAIGNLFPVIYAEQVAFGKEKAMSTSEKEWRNIRRGRYVEFNLVHDRGTKFGLHSNGRTESILMSLPPEANWFYNQTPVDERFLFTLQQLKKDIDWLNY